MFAGGRIGMGVAVMLLFFPVVFGFSDPRLKATLKNLFQSS